MSIVLRTLLIAFSLLSSSAFAADTPFPADWAKWTAVTTPLTKIGALPGCDADVSKLPPIYQETVATYCNVKAGGPGKVNVLVKPDQLASYKARNSKFGDGTNLILHLVDMKVLFVTGHKAGQPIYAVYGEDGKVLTNAKDGHPLAASTCTTCHTGFAAWCVGGQCGKTQ